MALPGFGTLMAKRAEGYPQAALTVLGFLLTMIFGVRFAVWFFKNTEMIFGDQSDPLVYLQTVWANVRWALLGMGLFVFSWLWSLGSNAAILRSVKRAAPGEVPPVLK